MTTYSTENITTTQQLTILEKAKELTENILIKNLAKDKDDRLVNFISTLPYQYKIHTILTPRGLYELSQYIFNDEDIRDFILGGSDELAILLSENPNDVTTVINTIVYGLSKNRLNKEGLSLIPAPILDTMQLDIEGIPSMLNENFWIVFVMLLCLFIPVGYSVYKN